MAQEYWRADEADDIVQKYMKYHADLVGARIACIFKEKATKSDGQPIVGKITKCSRKYQPLMDEPYDYVITLGADAWSELDNAQREAWIDHLLEHAYGVEKETTGEMVWKTRKPELMGFPSIIHRHGIHWMPGLPKIATLNVKNKASHHKPQKRNEDGSTEDSESTDSNGSYDDLMSDLN